ncbi:hypothetical protein KFL_003470090 [Klebsormidium nitens]|uniref:Vacuolar protein 8 n=1 Tax=Klebsormidium nitens TaxID=105231 RepID=A0A1Y1IBK7_KLENI|nr:hypothetical protein KFL_003470090 [Klebsormidium nitens]|eukprot:GAQ87352.1 hypothetical protein KFL_003470090 [Klebsormidium nitens]
MEYRMAPGQNHFERLSNDLLEIVFQKALWARPSERFTQWKARDRVSLEATCKRFQKLVPLLDSLAWDLVAPGNADVLRRYLESNRLGPLKKVALEVIGDPSNVYSLSSILELIAVQYRNSLQEFHLFISVKVRYEDWSGVFSLFQGCQNLVILDILFPALESLEMHQHLGGDYDSCRAMWPGKLFLWGRGGKSGVADRSDPAKMAVPRSLDSFVALLMSRSPAATLVAVDLLGELRYAGCAAAIAQVPGSIESLFFLFDSTSEGKLKKAAGDLLVSLARDGGIKKRVLAARGSLRTLVSCLQSGCSGVQERAAELIWLLADSKEDQQAMAKTWGLLRGLGGLLHSRNSACQERAARALLRVSLGGSETRVLIVDTVSGLLKRSVQLLCGKNPRVQDSVGNLLDLLMVELRTRRAMFHTAGCHRKLLENASGNAGAAKVLTSVMSDYDVRKSVAKVRLTLRRLIGLLSAEDGEVREAGAEIMEYFVADDEHRTVLGVDRLCLQGLASLLQPGSSCKAQGCAARALALLAYEDDTRIGVVELPNVAERLVNFLKSEEASTREAALEALQNLSVHEGAAKHIATLPGSLQSLVSLMDDESAGIAEGATATLANLLANEEDGGPLADFPGFADKVVSLLGRESAEVQMAASRALQNLSICSANARRVFATPRCLSRFVGVMRGENAYAKERVVYAIGKMGVTLALRFQLCQYPGILRAMEDFVSTASKV